MMAVRAERFKDDAEDHVKANITQVAVNQAADIAEHGLEYGLKKCALPSCDKREATVRQLRLWCSKCHAARYCSTEHNALHWNEHKPTCRATVAAKQAALEGGIASLNCVIE